MVRRVLVRTYYLLYGNICTTDNWAMEILGETICHFFVWILLMVLGWVYSPRRIQTECQLFGGWEDGVIFICVEESNPGRDIKRKKNSDSIFAIDQKKKRTNKLDINVGKLKSVNEIRIASALLETPRPE